MAMTHVDGAPAAGQLDARLQAGIGRIVDVAIHRLDGSDLPQRAQHARAADIAGVQNQRHAVERGADLVAKQAMGVGDQTDDAVSVH